MPHTVELEFPPIAFDPAISCRYGFPGHAVFGRHRRSERVDAYADPAGACDRHCDRRDRRLGQRALHLVLPDTVACGHVGHDLGDDRFGAMDHQLVDYRGHRQRAGHGGRLAV